MPTAMVNAATSSGCTVVVPAQDLGALIPGGGELPAELEAALTAPTPVC